MRRLQSLAQARAHSVACPKPTGAPKSKHRRTTEEQASRLVVWDRDGHRCRKCEIVVYEPTKTAFEFLMGQVAHIVSRRDLAVRCDPRNLLLLCPACHREVDGDVNVRYRVVGTAWFVVNGKTYIDGSRPVDFERVA